VIQKIAPAYRRRKVPLLPRSPDEIGTKADFLRFSTDFLRSLTPQISHEKWKNEIG
jgi:hypothetical protein